jgi:hypothetical protein
MDAVGVTQLGVDPSCAIDASIGLVDLFDFLQKPGVLERPL